MKPIGLWRRLPSPATREIKRLNCLSFSAQPLAPEHLANHGLLTFAAHRGAIIVEHLNIAIEYTKAEEFYSDDGSFL